MPIFSARSRAALGTCHADLQRLFGELIKETDFAVLCGHRSQADQERAFREGKSKAKWPQSKHNVYPSRAVDIVPMPVDWENLKAFYDLSEKVKAKAKAMGIEIRWGGNFSTLIDLPHWELV